MHVAFMRRASPPASTASMADPEDGKEVPPYANPRQSAARVPPFYSLPTAPVQV